MDNLNRFIDAQEKDYAVALSEIKQGRKQSHWMWYIFPQIKGLGLSKTTKFYALKDSTEAEAFLKHPVLGSRLINICKELLGLKVHNAHQIFGSPDDRKLKSSMTLFSMLPETDPVFEAVLQQFFGGAKDEKTINILNEPDGKRLGKQYFL